MLFPWEWLVLSVLLSNFKYCMGVVEPVLIVHGGAGTVSEDRIPGKLRGVTLAAKVGYQVLARNGTVVEAVEQAVRIMEADRFFNAGYGAALNIEGDVELDASIMDGATKATGSLSGLRDLLHPISLARDVMERSGHNFLIGDGLVSFALDRGFRFLEPPGQLVTQYSMDALEEWKASDQSYRSGEGGTVGAVAIDANGNIAAATSTGGVTGKRVGRVGDTPIIGSGTYADNGLGGVSLTGDGDIIMKVCLAYDVLRTAQLTDRALQPVADELLDAMSAALGGTAGLVALDRVGNVAVAHNSLHMSWAYQRGDTVAYGASKEDFNLMPATDTPFDPLPGGM
ncbi:probable isoaspartyl peptidase/L-asparaginase GA20639 [Anopheles gambiae]|uniref:probable isoaspartyl peptidase/L-asparaginase GA20639 n=1 Tax=Anopheles gambiae TaxID=7165 RepID=UPI002AC8B1C2|nr:probable isoaspartyl peptidase/L-asparaginase GA20639 [Anopheles gambiae]